MCLFFEQRHRFCTCTPPRLCVCVHVKARALMCVLPCVCRCEVDLSAVPVSQRRLFTLTLNPGRGVLVFLLAVNPCGGVSVSDLGAAPLDQPHERLNQLDNYVSTVTAADDLSVPIGSGGARALTRSRSAASLTSPGRVPGAGL